MRYVSLEELVDVSVADCELFKQVRLGALMFRQLFQLHDIVRKSILEQVLLRLIVTAPENGGLPSIILLVSDSSYCRWCI